MVERPASGRNFGGENRQGTPCLGEAEASLRRRLVVTDDAVSAWFIREILPLEANLMHYLQHNWRNASDLSDLRQEVYARVLQAAQEQIPDNPRNFLFVCARNLLINLVKREQVVPMDSFADLDALGVASATPQPDRLLIEREDIGRLEEALPHLPPRIREAIALAYFKGLSRVEIAKRMGISHQTASEYIGRGTDMLADILFGKSEDGSAKS